MSSARDHWREQHLAQRQQQQAEAAAAQTAQAHAAERRLAQGRRTPPIDSIEWAGQRWRVINRAEANTLLASIRDTDRARYLDIDAETGFFPAMDDETVHPVFLLADEPVRLSRAHLTAKLPGHAELHIDGLICRQGLTAIQFSTTAKEEGPGLYVLGPARIDKLVLAAGRHACTGGLQARVVVCSDYRSALLLHGKVQIETLIGAGNDVYCLQAPDIAQHATQPPREDRVMTRENGNYRFFTPTHLLHELLIPALLRDDERGRRVLDPARLLTYAAAWTRDDIGQVYSGFAGQLEQAFQQLPLLLQASGQAQLRAGSSAVDFASFMVVTEPLDGAEQPCHQLLRQIGHSEYVQLRALQSVNGGPLQLHIEHLTSPRKTRHSRWAQLDAQDAEALSIKRGLLDAIERLSRHYQRP